MKKNLIATVLLLLTINSVLQAQFISPMRYKEKQSTKKVRVATNQFFINKTKTNALDSSNIKNLIGLSTYVSLSDSIKLKDSVDAPENKTEKVLDEKSFQRQLLIGGLDNEGIAIVDLTTGKIGNNDRLTLSAAIAKTDSTAKTDIKTLLQAGGNLIASYVRPINFLTSNYDTTAFSCYGLFKTKFGAVLPAIGTTTNVVEVHIDPGVEFGFKLRTSKNEIVVVGAARLGFVWASKDYSDNIGLAKNFFPYFHITGGFEIPKFGQILYSQHFVSNTIFAGTAPKASIGFSLPISN